MKSVLHFLLLLAALSLLSACASTKAADTDPNGQEPSSMPWNKPESWEGTGSLGGAMGQ